MRGMGKLTGSKRAVEINDSKNGERGIERIIQNSQGRCHKNHE